MYMGCVEYSGCYSPVCTYADQEYIRISIYTYALQDLSFIVHFEWN